MTNLQKRYDRLLASFSELQQAAQKVVNETDEIHNSKPWPQKYQAPYGAITELRLLLAKQYGLRTVDRVERSDLESAARTILETFERDEAEGFRSRDRQFAIEILKKALTLDYSQKADQ